MNDDFAIDVPVNFISGGERGDLNFILLFFTYVHIILLYFKQVLHEKVNIILYNYYVQQMVNSILQLDYFMALNQVFLQLPNYDTYFYMLKVQKMILNLL